MKKEMVAARRHHRHRNLGMVATSEWDVGGIRTGHT